MVGFRAVGPSSTSDHGPRRGAKMQWCAHGAQERGVCLVVVGAVRFPGGAVLVRNHLGNRWGPYNLIPIHTCFSIVILCQERVCRPLPALPLPRSVERYPRASSCGRAKSIAPTSLAEKPRGALTASVTKAVVSLTAQPTSAVGALPCTTSVLA